MSDQGSDAVAKASQRNGEYVNRLATTVERSSVAPPGQR